MQPSDFYLKLIKSDLVKFLSLDIKMDVNVVFTIILTKDTI